MKKVNVDTKSCINYLMFNNLLHFMTIDGLEIILKAVEGTDDEPIIKSYLRDKKIEKILEN